MSAAAPALAAAPGESATQVAPRHAGAAAWLTLLFALLLGLNALGGWVRYSGAGLAIPHWPVIELDGGRRTLLPPFTAEGWQAAHTAWAEHQQSLAARVASGERSAAHLGRQPRDLGEFQAMFLTEWTHRLAAAVVGLVALGCLVTVLRDRSLRARAGLPLSAACLGIVAQAVIGGLLVADGTGTHWLFLHQGNAGFIVGCTVWAVLRLLSPAAAVSAARRGRLPLLALATLAAAWMELVLGALLAGSRAGAPPPPLGQGWVAALWRGEAGVAWNLLDNAVLHHAAHRGWAWLLAGLVMLAWWAGMRAPIHPRARLALQVAASFVAIQALLGYASLGMGVPPLVALAHQLLGMCLLAALVLALHDLRHEPMGVAP